MLLDQLVNLERVGNTVYVGFNAGITRIVFPKLTEIDGALIIENNAGLVEVELPALVRVARYVHVHENAVLTTLSLPALESVGGEVSLVDNPLLARVRAASTRRPVQLHAPLQVRGNKASGFPELFTVLAH